MTRQQGTKAQRFRATLVAGDRSLGWTIAYVPFDPADVWSERIRQRVKGTVNGFAFRSSLFPRTGGGGFYLLVNRAMQEGGGTGQGSTAEFVLEPDLEPRPAELPDELDVLLDQEPGLRAWYESLSEAMRREIGKWIVGVKSEEARARRAAQMAERLYETLVAEQDLPPAVAFALRGTAHGLAGWKAMPPSHRRTELFALTYYRTPESHARRLAKLVENAAARGRKLAEKQLRPG